MRPQFAVIGILVACIGCSTARQFAYINDVAVPDQDDTGFRIVSVDGKPEERAKSDYVTVVPFVMLESGTHTVFVRKRDRYGVKFVEPPEIVSLTVRVEAGHRYRIVTRGGVLALDQEPK